MRYLFFLVFVTSVQGFSQGKYERTSFNMPKLLTYQQLMYLPPKIRMQYIRDVRNAMAEMERAMNKTAREYALNDESSFRWYNLLNSFSLIEKAEAASKCGGDRMKLQDGRCAYIKEEACSSNEIAVTEKGVASASGDYCVSKNDRPTVATTAPVVTAPKPAAQAPAPPRPPAPIVPIVEPPVIARPAAPAAETRSATPAQILAPKTTERVPQTPRAIETAPVAPLAPAPAAPAPAAPAAPAAVAPAPESHANIPSGPPVGATAVKKCVLKGKKRAAIRRKFYKKTKETADSEAPLCIIGGSFSVYENNVPAAGKCLKITNDDNGADCGTTNDKVSMCERVLFCGPTTTSGFCPKVTQSHTKTCGNLAPRDCDPFQGKHAIDGAMGRWAYVVDKFNSMCTERSEFTEFFCSECNDMEKRMKTIEAKYAAYSSRIPGAGSGGSRAAPASPPPASR